MRWHLTTTLRALFFFTVSACALVAGCATSESGSPSTGDETTADSAGPPAQDSTAALQDSTSDAGSASGDDSASALQDDGAMADTAADVSSPDETGSSADGSADTATPDDGGATSDNASTDATSDSNSSQDVSVADAGDASLADADASDGGTDANNARSDASDAALDASDARSDASDATAMCAANVLVPVAAVSSSDNGAGFSASNVIDGDFTSRWDSVHGVDPQWIYLDFGAPVFVNRVQIAWQTACATNYDIQMSSNATVWTTLTSIAGNTEGGGPPANWTTAANHPALSGVGRYLRINGTLRCTTFGYSIWEMRVFGDTNATCHP